METVELGCVGVTRMERGGVTRREGGRGQEKVEVEGCVEDGRGVLEGGGGCRRDMMDKRGGDVRGVRLRARRVRRML